MNDTSRYDILFEPVTIGPVTAKNRFYQVPHCTGLGWIRPRMLNQLRITKAEGGWGVVCTEYCSIHPVSDDMPFPYQSIWDENDIRSHALMTEGVHSHGALAGVELWIGGGRSTNLFSREVPMSASSIPSHSIMSNMGGMPRQCRRMDRKDIANIRRWHRDAALRAKAADYDIVYVYATHGYLLSQFLSRETNDRSDEYGGSLENRVRLVRELIEETKDTVGDRCAVAVRFSVNDGDDEDGQPVHGEHREMFEMLAELPDLWDINIEDYSREMGVSRYIREGSLEPYMDFVKSSTSKPVVTVGRFTSPDTMVSQVQRGVVDLIGAARPSIADPFLPNKIAEGRVEEIRECIGCNICYAADGLAVPIRCTQNPTMGEEWRRNWHPEDIPPKGSNSLVLVVGGGPAGLEAARAAGQRGYDVLLAESTRELGGRVTRESTLPGLSEWARVRDYRTAQLSRMANVEFFLESRLDAGHALETGADHIVVATGATWRRDGYGRYNRKPMDALTEEDRIFCPDDIMDGNLPSGKTLVFDDDAYYMASVIAELLAKQGVEVIYVTPDSRVARWSGYTDEQYTVHRQLASLGVEMFTSRGLDSFDGEAAHLGCVYTGDQIAIQTENVVLVTARIPNDGLYYKLLADVGDGKGPRISKIGDCDGPSIIADAVFAGHRWARELDEETDDSNPFRYDRVFSDGV